MNVHKTHRPERRIVMLGYKKNGIVLIIIPIFLFLIFDLALAEDSKETPDDSLVTQELKEKEALIWYLGHSGWALKTKGYFLIFDYQEVGLPAPEELSLSNGFINPAEIKDQNVFVFVTHEHRDHYDPVIFRWEKSIKNITYIFGWEAPRYRKCIYLIEPRAIKTIDGMEILTINHSFDGIPEVAYLVKVEGLAIYHSGDHGSTGDVLNPIFKDNIDYLATKARNIDIAFISQFRGKSGWFNSGDLYTIQTLLPKVTFPMHMGQFERFYEEFARQAKVKRARTMVCCAKKRGDSFLYQDGQIK